MCTFTQARTICFRIYKSCTIYISSVISHGYQEKKKEKPHREAHSCTCCWSFFVYVQSTDTHKHLQTVVIFLSCFKQLFQGFSQPPTLSVPFTILFLSLSFRREWKWHFWACIPQLTLCRAPAWQRHIRGSVRLKLCRLWSSVTRQGIQTRWRTSIPWSCESQPWLLKSDEE